MKKRISILWFPVRLGLFFLLITISQLLSAQENRDSVHITLDGVPTKSLGTLEFAPLVLFPEKSATYPALTTKELNAMPQFSLKEKNGLPYYTNPSPLFRGDYSTDGVLKQFRHGVLFGSGKQTSVPGIGLFNNASLGYQHQFNDRLMLQLNANAMKINMPRINGQAFSTSGTLAYQVSDRVSFKFFGSYDIGNSYGMSTNQYGASMSIDMTDRFGMEMGVQRYYDSMRGRWETVPMVIPYYRFEKFKLGLDVGGILYEILRETVFDKQRNSGPTIGPPRFSMPIR